MHFYPIPSGEKTVFLILPKNPKMTNWSLQYDWRRESDGLRPARKISWFSKKEKTFSAEFRTNNAEQFFTTFAKIDLGVVSGQQQKAQFNIYFMTFPIAL